MRVEDGWRLGVQHAKVLAQLLVLFSLSFDVSAQIVDLTDTPVPEKYSLDLLYSFYVYAHEDAPAKEFGPPTVRFHDLSSHTLPGAPTADAQTAQTAVQMSLMKYERFWEFIDPHHFCCLHDEVERGRCEKDGSLLLKEGANNKDEGVIIHDIPFHTEGDGPVEDTKRILRETGVYILMFSNCQGSNPPVAVTGRVSVKNPYGYLPGTEYYKLPFYGWLSVLYTVLAFVWLGLSVKWWREALSLHACIAGVIFLGLMECFFFFVFFSDWNSDGIRSNVFFVVGLLSSVSKSIFSYMLVLVAALGWGTTRPYLDRATITWIQGVSLLYIGFGVAKETVLSFRHSHSLPVIFVLLCVLPASIVNGGIFFWVFNALGSLMTTLEERRQTEKLKVYQQLWWVLIFSLGVASCALVYQLCTLSSDISQRWEHKWLLTAGVPDMLFLVVLVAMMYLWAPNKHSQKYAYSAAECAPTSEEKPIVSEWAAEELGGDTDEFWEETHGGISPFADGPLPETIGATSRPTSAGVLQDAIADLEKMGLDTPQGKVE